MAFDSSTIRPRIGDLPEIDDLEDRATVLETTITPVVAASLNGKPDSPDIDTIVVVTQAFYDGLAPPDSRTLYVIVG